MLDQIPNAYLVLRALGVPARMVTCVRSAHDADESITIDEVFVRRDDGGFDRLEREVGHKFARNVRLFKTSSNLVPSDIRVANVWATRPFRFGLMALTV